MPKSPPAAKETAKGTDGKAANDEAAAVAPSPPQVSRNREFAPTSIATRSRRLDFSDAVLPEESIQKRQKKDDVNTDLVIHCINDVPIDILARCIGILGPGHFRYVAGSCRVLRLAHRKAFENHDSVATETIIKEVHNEEFDCMDLKRIQNEIYPTYITFGSAIASSKSVALFKLWENETTPEYKDEEYSIVREAITPVLNKPHYPQVTKILSRVGALGCSAARCGNLSLLQHLVQEYPESCSLEKESENGSKTGEPVQFHQQGGKEKGIKGNIVPMSWTESAAESGQLEVCKWLFDITERNDKNNTKRMWSSWYNSPTGYYHLTHSHYAVHAACRGRQWDALKWALSDPNQLISQNTDGGQYFGACLIPLGWTGDRDIFRWISALNSRSELTDLDQIPLVWAGIGAANAGRIDILDTLLEFGFFAINGSNFYSQNDVYTTILSTALRTAKFDLMDWFSTNLLPKALEIAGENYFENNSEQVYDEAVTGGLEAMQWLDSKQFPCPTSTSYPNLCFAAARENNLKLLQWLRSKGCEWDEMVTKVAKERGYEEIYQWAVKNGCPKEDELGRMPDSISGIGN